jgi:hypothetical protein
MTVISEFGLKEVKKICNLVYTSVFQPVGRRGLFGVPLNFSRFIYNRNLIPNYLKIIKSQPYYYVIIMKLPNKLILGS